LRIRQWSKNLLVFLPALLAHRIFQSPILGQSILAFIAFSLCASSVYIVNDLLDLQADRRHPRKRERAFASGRLAPRSGVFAAFALLVAALGVALLLGFRFVAVLFAYYVVTWAYSTLLKRVALIDVLTLAALYAARIVAGSVATTIPLSLWFLAFCVFMFLSLGIVKRYTEINEAARAGAVVLGDRGYRVADLPLLLTLGVTAGYCVVVIVALYISSPDAVLLYRHRETLWLVCPLVLYWVSRVWLLATRGEMADDPVVFATSDWTSLVVLLLIVVVGIASI
jgi:4-hydroxybenzoate polyprenyltransferase